MSHLEKSNAFQILIKIVLKNLLRLATKESVFIFDKTFHKQLDSVAIGFSLGQALANLENFYAIIKKGWLDKWPEEIKPVFYRNSVGYIFVLFRKEEHLVLKLPSLRATNLLNLLQKKTQ